MCPWDGDRLRRGCATDGFNYCNAPTAGGCVSYTGPNFSDCCYEISSRC